MAISFAVTLLQQESLYDYLPNSLVARAWRIRFPKNLGVYSGWSIVRDFSALKGSLQQIS